MPRLGDHTGPDQAQSRVGAARQQVAQKLTMTERGRVTDLGGWIRGLSGSGSLDYRLALWRWDGDVSNNNTLLGQSAEHSSSAAAQDPDNLVQVTWPLETPVELDAGQTVLVGLAQSTDVNGGQWGLRTGGGNHYMRDRPAASTPWPVSMRDCYTDGLAAAFWIENYDLIGSAWIRRSGAWVRASSVQVRRSGAWADADTVAVRRTGAWTDAD